MSGSVGSARPPTVKEDWEKAKGDITFSGLAIAAVLLLLPASGSAIIGAEDAADPIALFVSVALFTLPLSLGVAIWAIAFIVHDSWTNVGVLAWSLVVAVAAFSLAAALGQEVDIDLTLLPPGIQGAFAVVGRILGGFWTAYGEAVFISALIVGGTLAWLYREYVHHRVTS
jgi:hypothetical protein